MVFFTKIEFKTNMDGFKFLGQKNLSYEIHQLVENLQTESSSQNRILWRFEELKDRMPFILVQTNFSPNIERFKNSFNFSKAIKEEVQIKSLDFKAFKEEKFIFKLRANPTKVDNKSKKRIPVGVPSKNKPLEVQKDEISKWLKNKESIHGFSILNYDFYNENIAEIDICKSKKFSATYNSILFTGTLIVHDPEKFKLTIENGIGSAKGFGLLSIKKI